MSTMGMPQMDADPGDENDSKWQECEQDIEDLEARVAAIEQKLGIQSPADEDDTNPPAPPMKPQMKMKGKPGSAPFFGSY